MMALVLSFFLFFSGAAGLVYQLIWTRMLYLVFGVSTYSVVAVTSGFMAGLAIGSFLAGQFLTEKIRGLRVYGLLELVIGITAGITPFVFAVLPGIYGAFYRSIPNDQVLLVVKFILTFLSIVIPTTAMGATLPTVIHFLSTRSRQSTGRNVSLLYGINTLGALVGTLITGYYFIETIGLRNSAFLAAGINIVIGSVVFLLSMVIEKGTGNTKQETETIEVTETTDDHSSPRYSPLHITLALATFAISGAISMAYEVAWIRMLTPTTGTFVYAFTVILSLILFGIGIGSLISRLFIKKTSAPLSLFGIIECIIGVAALCSIIVLSYPTPLPKLLMQILVLLPATIAMGMTFPVVTSLTSSHPSRFVGFSYGLNTIGSMIGPIAAGFILLPHLGKEPTITLLAAVNIILGSLLILVEPTALKKAIRFGVPGMAFLILFPMVILIRFSPTLLQERTLRELTKKTTTKQYVSEAAEDETAHVYAYRKTDNSEYGLLVDGIGMSVLVDETKLMAHLPILTHPNPKDMLVICFGMGTTFRSSLSYGINVDAVELVPSVPKMFPIFFPDAKKVMANPRARVIINDGRNYVRITDKKYDIIQVDPPPPINAAGTTVLYSREFYEDAKRIMNPKGLFLQWMFYGTRADDMKMLLKSFTDAFPYVSVFHSPRQIGIYLIGSTSPIPVPNGADWDKKLRATPAALTDVTEWGPWDGYKLASIFWGDRTVLHRYLTGAVPVTDDRPNTEYFYLRQSTSFYNIARDEVISGAWPEK
jgi:spermidine synthase